MQEPVEVRPARPQDAPSIAALVVEGFGQEYGGVLRRPAGLRAIERIYLLPGRLQGVMVAVDPQDQPIGMAGIRTTEAYWDLDQREQMVMLQELGTGLMLQLELWGLFSDPPPYKVKRHEAFVYSVTVTEHWRGRGVADALMERLHTAAKERGKRTMVLEVVANNEPARRLYARHGYTLRRQRRGLLAWLPFVGIPRLLLEKKLDGISD